MATVGVALILACATFLTYEQLAFRDSMKTDLDLLADIFGSSSTAALSFGDPKDAGAILAESKADRSITRADFYSADGKPFAEYVRDPQDSSATPRVRPDSSWFEDNRLKLFKHTAIDSQRIGTIYLETDLDELHSRLKRFAEIVGGVLFLSSLLALAPSARLQRIISRPIAHLAATAQAISRERITRDER